MCVIENATFTSRMKINPVIFLLFLAFSTYGQKVGVVLSGGGAKGLAHVGVLKALEENDIPVDYIVGTSMGAVIGGSYAAGISPDQIEEIILSDKFLQWINGTTEAGLNYYYHSSNPNPGFVKVNLALDSTFNFQFGSAIANDLLLNFALAELMAQANANAHYNFDSLFVPLRVMAADIFTQNEVVLSKGNLSDAVRASQAVPYFYNPVKIDGKYLFDGGVYNNFPVDVAEREFSPDVMIGVNVSSKIFNEYPYENDESLISKSLIYMLLDKSDPKRIDENGIYIQPNIKGYTSFDFKFAKSLIDSGYFQTLRQMDEIKRKISRQKTCEEVSVERNKFNFKNAPLLYKGIEFNGFTDPQAKYIRKVFRVNRSEALIHHSQIKEGYYKLISENYFNNIYPNINYDSATGHFELALSKRKQKNFGIDFGGVIATRDVSNIYLGLNYYHFNNSLMHTYLGFHTGSFYKAVDLSTRIDLPYFNQIYVEPYISDLGLNYLENGDLIQSSQATILKRGNRKIGLNLGIPVGGRFKSAFVMEGFNDLDRYSNNDVFVSSDTLDELRIKGYKAGVIFSSNSLNHKQYASAGRAFSVKAFYFNVDSDYKPGNTSTNLSSRNPYQWFRLNIHAEQYFNKGSFYKPGYLFEAVLSNQPVFQNYRATVINAPAFYPMQDSPSLILENFRTFNYLSAGIRNVFTIKRKLDFRLEAYVFKPLVYLSQESDQQVEVKTDLTNVYLASMASIVHHSPIGPISLSVNYYDDSENKLGVLLHVGFLLYNDHSIER